MHTEEFYSDVPKTRRKAVPFRGAFPAIHPPLVTKGDLAVREGATNRGEGTLASEGAE